MNGKSAGYNPSLFEHLWGWSFAIAILGIIIVTFVISDTRELPMTIIGVSSGRCDDGNFATFFSFQRSVETAGGID